MLSLRISYRLFRYLLQETLPYILLTLIVLTALIFAQQVAKQADLFFQSATSLLLSLKVMSLLIPGVLLITFPFALLIGSLLALNRLSSDSEVIAARASGISLFSFALPLLICGLIGTAICFFLTLYVNPKIYSEAKILKTQLLLQALTAPVKPQTFDNHFPNHLLYLREIDSYTGDWLGVFIVRKTNEQESVVFTAQKGRLRMTQTAPIALEVELFDGLILSYQQNHPEHQTAIKFTQQAIKLSQETPFLANLLDKEKASQEMSLAQLSLRGNLASTPQERRQSALEWHRRLSLPFACLFLVIVAIPLGSSSSRQSGRAMAFTIGFTLSVAYYLLVIAGQNLALSGALPVWIGLWLPNTIALLSAILLLSSSPQLVLRARQRRAKSVVKNETTHPSPIKRNEALIHSLKHSPSRFRLTPLNLINYLLLSEYCKYFLIAAAILVSTSLIFTLFDLVPSIGKSGLGWQYTLGYLAYLAPQILYYISPFALLLALLTVTGVLMKSQQITALQTSGQSLLKLSLPLIFFCFFTIGGLFWLSEKILPGSNQEQDFRFNRIKGKKIEQAVMALGQSWVQGLDGTIYGYQYNAQLKKLLNTTAYRFSTDSALISQVQYWPEAKSLSTTQWEIPQGWSSAITPDFGVTFLHQKTTSTQIIADGIQIFNRTVNEATKMNFLTLKQYIHYLSELGNSTTSLRVDLEKKLAFPFSCLPLLAIGLPFAMQNSKRGTMAGVGISILIGFIYWITASVFESAGRQAYFPPGLSVWGPQALFFALGATLIFRLKK